MSRGGRTAPHRFVLPVRDRGQCGEVPPHLQVSSCQRVGSAPRTSPIERCVMRTLPILFSIAAIVLLTSISPASGSSPSPGGKFGRGSPDRPDGSVRRRFIQAGLFLSVPMTVECWVKLPPKPAADAMILASQPRRSNEHWELLCRLRRHQEFLQSVGGHLPKQVNSPAPIADGQWHFLAMTFDGTAVRLYVDAKEVANEPVKKVGPYPDTEPADARLYRRRPSDRRRDDR